MKKLHPSSSYRAQADVFDKKIGKWIIFPKKRNLDPNISFTDKFVNWWWKKFSWIWASNGEFDNRVPLPWPAFETLSSNSNFL